MRRPVIIAGCFILAATFLWTYFATRLPPGIDAKGEAPDWIPWLTLAGAFLSLITGIVTLVLKLVEMRLKFAEIRAKKS